MKGMTQIQQSEPKILNLTSAIASMSAALDMEQIKTYLAMLYVARSDLRMDPGQLVFQIPMKDLRTLSGLSCKDPRRLKTNVRALRKADVVFDYFKKDGDEGWTDTGLVASSDLKKIDGEWVIVYDFSRIVIEKILRPITYSQLNMDSISRIKKSKYTVILYGFIRDFTNPKNPHISPPVLSISDLRSFLRLGNKYALVADLRRSVIEPAMKELFEETDLIPKCEYVMEGGKIVAVKFSGIMKEKQRTIDTKDIDNLGGLLGLIPTEYQLHLKQIVADTLAKKGFEYCKSNIEYAIKTTNGKNPEALVSLALRDDYAKGSREKEEESKQTELKTRNRAIEKEKGKQEIKLSVERQQKKEVDAVALYESKSELEKKIIDEWIKDIPMGSKPVRLVLYFIEKGDLR